MIAAMDIARPGIRLGPRPEVIASADRDGVDEFFQKLLAHRVDSELRSLRRFGKRLKAIAEAETHFVQLDLLARNCVLLDLKKRLAARQLRKLDLVQAFAMIRVAVEQSLGIRLHDEQLYAGWCLLAGHFVEMNTGEGKTVTAALPAIVMAMAAVPVHVISANEYLVSRDSAELEPVYRWFGLSLGLVLAEQDEAQKRQGYGCDITYCTHQQVVFDYLRDTQILKHDRHGLAASLRDLLEEQPGLPVQRGLCFAIVDEADSVLIDDARTPLILSETSAGEGLSMSEAAVALAIARSLQENGDYLLKREIRQARLTDSGLRLVRERTAQLSGSWQFERYRQERVCQALAALHLHQRDVDYLVQQDRVELIDQATGRPTPQRRLQHGLHRLLEVKERCSVSDESNPIASLSYQRFFARYHRLCGMSGTLKEASGELRRVYGPHVLSVPPVRPSRRRMLPLQIAASRTIQLEMLLQQVQLLRSRGRAILVGTRTVRLSDEVSRLLSAHGIDHEVLNARQDSAEALVVAAAGRSGQVTVATNMAGRGTDIKPEAAVVEAGGLHVLNLEINDSRRVDRQLQGRAARQGQPGSCQDILCVDDDVLKLESGALAKRLLSMATAGSTTSNSSLVAALIRRAQRRVESRHRQQRIAVARGQTQLQRILAVGGRSE
ncbi:preprotein translocase subunit SecA [Granulosicoccus sp. 3-233]|uniref:preprotein translocase subunit SecA n=1 Tax=Granulosicoccus sp. 3-233 TaxID=3417969 RepID=UPI003D33B7B1